jgi:DNA gyrase subunit B
MEVPASYGVDTVRKRPGMYVGSTADGAGIQTLAREAISNALQEVAAGAADRIEIELDVDGVLTIRDNGRGIPTDIHNGVAIAAQVFTQILPLNLAQERRWSAYQGVGMCVVNALSERLQLRIWRSGCEYAMQFNEGVPDGPLSVVGATDRSGTEVTFLPDRSIFGHGALDLAAVERWLRELSLPNKLFAVHLATGQGVARREVTLICEHGVIR